MLRGDVGDRDAGGHFGFGAVVRDGQVGGQSGATEEAQVERHGAMLDGAEGGGDATGRFQLDRMALAVSDGEGVAGKAVAASDGESGGGIETAGQQDDGGSRHGEISGGVLLL